MKDYAVVSFHKPSDDSPRYAATYLFSTVEAARDYLQLIWEDFYNTVLAEYEDLNEEECYHEDRFAQLKWVDGDFRQYIISQLMEPTTFPTK